MSSYRAYVLTLKSGTTHGVLHLSRFAELCALLDHFRTQLCAADPFHCDHTNGFEFSFERVWFTDGFVTIRPEGAVPGVDHLTHRCSAAILGAL